MLSKLFGTRRSGGLPSATPPPAQDEEDVGPAQDLGQDQSQDLDHQGQDQDLGQDLGQVQIREACTQTEECDCTGKSVFRAMTESLEKGDCDCDNEGGGDDGDGGSGTDDEDCEEEDEVDEDEEEECTCQHIGDEPCATCGHPHPDPIQDDEDEEMDYESEEEVDGDAETEVDEDTECECEEEEVDGDAETECEEDDDDETHDQVHPGTGKAGGCTGGCGSSPSCCGDCGHPHAHDEAHVSPNPKIKIPSKDKQVNGIDNAKRLKSCTKKRGGLFATNPRMQNEDPRITPEIRAICVEAYEETRPKSTKHVHWVDGDLEETTPKAHVESYSYNFRQEQVNVVSREVCTGIFTAPPKIDLNSALQFRYFGKSLVGCGARTELQIDAEDHLSFNVSLKLGLRRGEVGDRVRLEGGENGGRFQISRKITEESQLLGVPQRFLNNVHRLRIIDGSGPLSLTCLVQVATKPTPAPSYLTEIYGENLHTLAKDVLSQEILPKSGSSLRRIILKNDILGGNPFDCSSLRRCAHLEELILDNLNLKGLSRLPVCGGCKIIKIKVPISVQDAELIWRNNWNLKTLHLEIDERLQTSKYATFSDVLQYANEKAYGLKRGTQNQDVFSGELFQKMANSCKMKDLVLSFRTHFYDFEKASWPQLPGFYYTPLKQRLEEWLAILNEDLVENGDRTFDTIAKLEEEERVGFGEQPSYCQWYTRGQNRGPPTMLKISVLRKKKTNQIQGIMEH